MTTVTIPVNDVTDSYINNCLECEELRNEVLDLKRQLAKMSNVRYEWASIINRLACLALDDDMGSNDRDYANDMLEMVNPYLGLDEE